MKEKFAINAAMEDDMWKMLKNWGYMESLERGDIKCPCGKTITKENLAAIKPKGDKILFFHSIICLE